MLFIATLLGIVEGLTEFLPISSTGHLILAGSLLRFTGDKVKVSEIVIQTGAILAVLLLYRKKLGHAVFTLHRPASRRLAVNVAVGFRPAAVLGLALGKTIKSHLFTPLVVASTFIAGAL